jgi:hypothetical protein
MVGNKLWFFWVVQVVISTCCHPVERYVFILFYLIFVFVRRGTKNEKAIEEEEEEKKMKKKK